MNTKELIEKIEALPAENYKYRPWIDKKVVLGLVRELDEPQKVVVPQFVAEHIEWTKEEDFHLLGAMNRENFDKKLEDWFYTDDNMELFARAWLDGYEVEKEKLYWVKLKAVDQYLVSAKDEKFLGFLQSKLRSKFTRKELEDLGFGWVFDCPGIEIEEVE
jgi:hypothetical protein